ncbi:MAG: LLM class flavin-dependent oxidoreductase [Dehalococcoidia bacterium]|nr:LLM class flavin-dependent oxidoreductase [Dehalococcoidia bacterium]
MSHNLAINVEWQFDLAAGRQGLLDRIQAADEAGAHSVWVEEAWGRDAFSLLTQVVDRTQRVRLATGIVNVFSRTPGALGQHFATLDELSGGRVIAGLGTSGAAVIEDFHGAEFRAPLRRTDSYVRALRRAFAGQPLREDEEGNPAGIPLAFRPIRADVPIFLAALMPKSLAQVGRIADGWLPIWTPLEAMRGLVDSIVADREEGRPLDVRSPGRITVTDQVDAARQEVKSTVAFYIVKMGDFYAQHLRRLGYEALVEDVRSAWAEGGRAGAMDVIPDDLQQSFWFVTSDTSEARDRLAQQDEAGITVHQVDARGDQEAVRRIFSELAR